jgi:hypothetical protein
VTLGCIGDSLDYATSTMAELGSGKHWQRASPRRVVALKGAFKDPAIFSPEAESGTIVHRGSKMHQLGGCDGAFASTEYYTVHF